MRSGCVNWDKFTVNALECCKQLLPKSLRVHLIHIYETTQLQQTGEPFVFNVLTILTESEIFSLTAETGHS